ncbi:MAG TPA: hypothetical protein ENF37_02010 [Beggiatoa sp.]|nr:hypothetical protein [Beggiatoa sp.]
MLRVSGFLSAPLSVSTGSFKYLKIYGSVLSYNISRQSFCAQKLYLASLIFDSRFHAKVSRSETLA